MSDLKSKDNELLVLVGNGFSNSIDFNIWDFEKAPYRSAPKLYLGMYSGKKKILETDESFEVFDSPITFDDYRAGERYDARLEESSLSRNGRHAVLCASPNGEIKKCTANPIKAFEKIFVKEIIKNDEGYIFDFGKNVAGICNFKINGISGQRIDFFYGEVVINGKLDMDNISFPGRNDVEYVQHGVYVCKEGYQEYQPSFAYYGFRYVFVKGLKEEQVSKEILECSVLHSDIKKSGEFCCSNEIVNKIQDCVINSNYGNFYYFPTDCPHREKNGWLDDAGLSAEQFCYNHGVYDSLREWLFNIRKAQLSDGRLPGMVPTATWGYEWGSGPFTDIALMEIPYQLYRFYGKKEIIKENLPAIEKYLAYLSGRENEEGLYAFGLGDWCEIGHHIEGAWSPPLDFTDSALAVQMNLITAKLCLGINQKAKRDKYLAEAERIKGNIRKKFVSKDGKLIFSTQTGLAISIALGIFNEKEIPSAVETLVDLIGKSEEHLNVGIVGSKYILDVLCEYGYADLAYRMAVNPTWPSYADIIYKGGTSLWEIFMNFKPVPNQYERVDGENRRVSLNHHFYGSVSAWFYKRLAGLNIISDKEVEICPYTVEDLTFASASYESGKRNITVRWDKKEEKVIISVINNGFKGLIKYKDKTLKLKNGENVLVY